MKLLLLRHGIAEGKAHPNLDIDFHRQLTEKGRVRLHAIFQAIEHYLESVDEIQTSPRIRALETATIARDYIPEASWKVNEALDYINPSDLLAKKILTWPQDRTYLLVGHNPHLLELSHHLMGLERVLLMPHKKGGMIELKKQEDGLFSLEQLIAPRLFF